MIFPLYKHGDFPVKAVQLFTIYGTIRDKTDAGHCKQQRRRRCEDASGATISQNSTASLSEAWSLFDIATFSRPCLPRTRERQRRCCRRKPLLDLRGVDGPKYLATYPHKCRVTFLPLVYRLLVAGSSEQPPRKRYHDAERAGCPKSLCRSSNSEGLVTERRRKEGLNSAKDGKKKPW